MKGNQFNYKYCHYSCNRKFYYDKHLDTEKYKHDTNQINNNNNLAKVAKPKMQVQIVKIYIYIYNIRKKEYECNSGLWTHKKVCVLINKEDKNLNNELINVLTLNCQLQSKLLEQNNIIIEVRDKLIKGR